MHPEGFLFNTEGTGTKWISIFIISFKCWSSSVHLLCMPESLLLVIRRKLTSLKKCAIELCLTFTWQDTQLEGSTYAATSKYHKDISILSILQQLHLFSYRAPKTVFLLLTKKEGSPSPPQQLTFHHRRCVGFVFFFSFSLLLSKSALHKPGPSCCLRIPHTPRFLPWLRSQPTRGRQDERRGTAGWRCRRAPTTASRRERRRPGPAPPPEQERGVNSAFMAKHQPCSQHPDPTKRCLLLLLSPGPHTALGLLRLGGGAAKSPPVLAALPWF